MFFVPARLLSGRTVRCDCFKDGLAILVHVALNLRDTLVGNLIVQCVVVVVRPQLADDIQHNHGHVERMTGLYTRQCLLSYQTHILRREQDECRFERRERVQVAIAHSSPGLDPICFWLTAAKAWTRSNKSQASENSAVAYTVSLCRQKHKINWLEKDVV